MSQEAQQQIFAMPQQKLLIADKPATESISF